MFFPHYSEIEIDRAEPDSSISIDELERIAKERMSFIAERVVANSFFKGKKIKKSTQAKIRKLEEVDARKKALESFMTLWNEWRRFYFDAGPQKLKTTSQMGAVESIIELAKDNDLNLTMLIACTHKAYAWGKLRPNFTAVISRGLEFYEEHYDSVVADVDGKNYEEDAIE